MNAGNFQPIVIHQTEQANYPLDPEVLIYLEGRANFLISVDVDGKLVDVLPIYYSDPAFAESARYALRKWTFDPARLDGLPVSATKEVDFNFERHGIVVVSQSVGEFVDGLFRRHFPDANTYRAYNLNEIDGKLSAVRLVNPRYTDSLAARRVSGTVMLAYYVDEKGRVRMPVTVNDADPELADLAVAAVKQWQFAPPKHKGLPALVRVCQSIRFYSPARS